MDDDKAEIVRLRAENAALLTAMKKIIYWAPDDVKSPELRRCNEIARTFVPREK